MKENECAVSNSEDEQRRERRSQAARRALAEAEARRDKAANAAPSNAPEFNGRGGLEPNRYGDWEVKGLACDF